MEAQIEPTYDLAFDFSYRFFPESVLEKRWAMYVIAAIVGVVVVIPLYQSTPPHLKVPLAIFAGVLHFVGMIFDISITHRLFQLGRWFEAHGYEIPFKETNPFLPDAPTLKDLLTAPVGFIELIVICILFFVPPFSLILFVGHMYGIITNLTYEKRGLLMKDILTKKKRLMMN